MADPPPVPAFGWRRTGALPYLSGGFSVGCIELEVPTPTAVGACPVLVLYPSLDNTSAHQRPEWLTGGQSEQLGRAQLAEQLGEPLAMFLMRHLGPLATGLLRIPAARGLQPAPLPQSRIADGWPVCVISHGLTGWPTAQTALAASLCAHGAVVLLICHCDGTACVGRCADADRQTKEDIDVQYQDWKVRQRVMRDLGVQGPSLMAEGEAWRRQQNEHRVLEVHAALDGLNQLLRSADPDNFEGFHARTDREVALFGHSFGGATVAACVLRDGTLGTRARFSHCFLFDPWIGGAACPLAESELHARRLTSELRTLRVWLNDGSGMRKNAGASAAALVGKAREAGARTADVLCVPSNSHYAQTDVPTVFENGPLACIYAAVKGKSDPDGKSITAHEALRNSISDALEPLVEESWLAIGLAPLGG